MQLLGAAGKTGDFLFLHRLGGIGIQSAVDFRHLGDALADGHVVGQRAAEPAFGNAVHAGGVGQFLHDLAELPLGADKQDFTAVGDGALQKVAGRGDLIHRLGEVDDRNTVLGAIDVILHLRVPAAGLMSEMTPGFQQIIDTDFRHFHGFLSCLRRFSN